VTALVLVHQGLDVSLALEPVPGGAGARHRDGPPVVVTGRADRAALEWALAVARPVLALTIGPPEAAGVLAWARARGAARAIRIWDGPDVDLARAARLVAAAVRRLGPDLVLAGERGLAGASGALPALVAARLGWPLLDGATRLAVDGSTLVAERRLGGGRREEVAAPCPAVATTPADAAEPRYVSVRARRVAAARGHETWTAADLGVAPESPGSPVRVLRLDWPRPRARRTAEPVAAGSAAERLRRLVGGPARPAAPGAPAAPGDLVEGDPVEVATRILAFLARHGFVRSAP
jgi:electron transfer flavoprotein beta subunit